mmetsp:Transcript_54793/g.146262  ORF Transcript_54793/g.146262 Transcript_54793/m.146262 type:complete len:243 (-) Transcript_54793:46-774(-)
MTTSLDELQRDVARVIDSFHRHLAQLQKWQREKLAEERRTFAKKDDICLPPLANPTRTPFAAWQPIPPPRICTFYDEDSISSGDANTVFDEEVDDEVQTPGIGLRGESTPAVGLGTIPLGSDLFCPPHERFGTGSSEVLTLKASPRTGVEPEVFATACGDDFEKIFSAYAESGKLTRQEGRASHFVERIFSSKGLPVPEQSCVSKAIDSAHHRHRGSGLDRVAAKDMILTLLEGSNSGLASF